MTGTIGQRTSTQRRVWPLILWLTALVGATALFHALGSGHLAPPPWSPVDWADWAADRDPLLATVAVLRMVVLALCWYLVGATGIGVIARALRAVQLVRLADALTVPMVRRVLQSALGVTMATVVATAAVPASAQALRPGDRAPSATEITDEGDESDEGDGADGVFRPQPRDGHVTLRPQEGGSADVGPRELTLRPTLDVDSATRSEPATDYEVRAGDSFWSIAVARLAAAWDRPVTDQEVTGYWQVLVESNRDRLAVAEDPDLIFPGQRFTLPPPPAAPDAAGRQP